MSYSLKRLFEKNNSYLSKTSLDAVGAEVESADYIIAHSEERKRYLLPVDFSNPENFARFGSAEKYYSASVEHIYNNYPYDGSKREIVDWHNSASYLDNFIFDELYPRTNGYIRFSHTSWGSQLNSSNRYGLSDGLEYIRFRGGPHSASSGMTKLASSFASANVYDVDKKRESNLRLDGAEGNTVEFWLRKDGFNTALTEKEVILDIHTPDSLPAAAQYGRLTIELSGTNTINESPIWVTYMSGTSGIETAPIGASVTTASLADGLWHHYAISFQNTTGSVEATLYVDGTYNDSITSGSTIQAVSGALVGSIGSLIATPANMTTPTLGWGKLSGSLDEFRFWKTKRDPQEIGRNWFTNVYGGSNSDDANIDLGVYYKFNEGLFDASVTDARDADVLDYSGRITNGTWIGYAAGGREAGSAIVESSASATEFKDPIIFADNGDVGELKRELGLSGSIYDRQSNTNLFLSFPQWIVEDDERNDGNVLKDLTQIIASYFDDLYLLTEQLPKIKQDSYISGTFKPAPFANMLLESSGFVTPELFVDSTVLEELMSRNEEIEFTEKIYDVKNLIYKNIYNNLVYIYKSKGTENAFRNLIRCFGVDDELIKLTLYSDNTDYLLNPNVRSSVNKKPVINFNTVDYRGGTVYQQNDPANVNSISFISGNVSASYLPRTIEAEILFPKKPPILATTYTTTAFVSSSLFGMHTANSNDDTDLVWNDPDNANFQVYAIRDQYDSDSVYFVLTGTSTGIIPSDLTSSLFENVYDNQKWNFAVRLVPVTHPWVDFVTGSVPSNFEIQFYGCNLIDNRVQNEFSVSGSITSAQGLDFSTSSHRVYVGAHRTNFDGALRESCDVRVSSLRYWMTNLSNEEIQAHAKNSDNVGVSNPFRSAYTFEEDVSDTQHVFVPRIDTLALNWDFHLVTGSDGSGQFVVDDSSSGSVDLRTRYGWLGTILKNQHAGLGNFFTANKTDVVQTEYLYSVKQNLPENLYSSNMVEILTQDDLEFTRESRPIKHFFAFEKSMYQSVSEEMLNMFATIKDFNSLIGEPVNRYRQDYKDMSKLRQLFFERVSNNPDLDKFVEFYKWLDSSMAVMLQQLIPASAIFSDKLHTMVESHVLERNKYWHKFPTLEFVPKEPTGSMEGINRHLYNWKFGHAPILNPRPAATATIVGTAALDDATGTSFILRNADASTVTFATDPTLNFGDVTADTGDAAATATIVGTADLDDASGTSFKLVNVDGEIITFTTDPTKNFGDTVTETASPFTVNTRDISGGSETRKATQAFWISCKSAIDAGILDMTIDPASFAGTEEEFTLTQTTVGTAGNTAITLITGVTADGETTFTGGTDQQWRVNTRDISGGSEVRKATQAFWIACKGAIDAGELDMTINPASFAGTEEEFTLTQTTVGATGNTAITLITGVTADGETTFTGGADVGPQNVNCLYWKERAERTGNGLLVHDDAELSEDRSLIHTASLQVLERKWTTPYRFAVDESKNIHGGINYKRNKKINAIQQGELRFDRADPLEFSASSVAEKRDCIDVYNPNAKFRYGFGDNEKRKEFFAPFNLYSSSVLTGHIADQFTISRTRLEITNLHSDAYGDNKEIPMQGPFTDKYVGGYEHRHVDITVDPAVTSSGDNNRPEAWDLIVDDNVIKIQPVNISSSDRPKAIFSRDGLAKRPVNIKNIKHTTGSSTILGNFDKNYQVVMTSGRKNNNIWFVKNEGISNTTADSLFFSGVVDFALPQRDTNKTVIVERFSAPGGPDVSSRGILDSESEEYSVYNAMPWRNLSVRLPLNVWSSQRCERFGLRSGTAARAIDYDGTASYHKTNRNRFKQAVEKDGGQSENQTDSGIFYKFVHDNWFVQHAIPRSDIQYTWMTASVASTKTLGYQSASTNYDFVSASDFGSTLEGVVRTWGRSFSSDDNADSGFIFTDFVGMNTNLYEPLTASTNHLGQDSIVTITSYRNTDLVPGTVGGAHDAELFNSLMLKRNGPYQFPSWKQIRGNEHPIARDMVKNNRYSRDNRTRPRSAATLISYTEPPITSKFKPLVHTLSDKFNKTIRLRSTYGNNLVSFANANLERDTATTITNIDAPQSYNDLLRVHNEVNGVNIKKISYRETIYPKQVNTYLNETRQRDGTGFTISFWADSRSGRKQTDVLNSQGFTIGSQSVWALDARENFTTADIAEVSGTGGLSGGGEGELQTNWTTYHSGNFEHITASAQYVRRNPADLANGSDVLNGGCSDTLWEAGTQAGKNPFYYKDYNDYAQELRAKGKEYSIIPEFRISEHMEYYIGKNNGNFLASNPAFLSITGAAAPFASAPSHDDASDSSFFKTYSHSDFLKHFELIEEDHKDSLKPSRLTLTCNGLMKFVPYSGFYPVSRTLELATLFSRSYGANVDYQGGESANTAQAWRAFLTPMFAPGIMYNTIKSGLAVDYPIFTGDWNQTNNQINSSFDKRLPFETLVEPENFLAAVASIVDAEPHEKARLQVTASWNGVGKLGPLYKLAMHNFLAESTDFFLDGGRYTSFKSLPQGHPNFGVADPNITEYTMDIKLAQDNVLSPLYIIGDGEQLMYSSASAFGPPCHYELRSGFGGESTMFPFTPPHFTYAAYARLRFAPFKAVGDETKYTLDEIVSHLNIDYAHGFSLGQSLSNYVGPGLEDWMQLSASISLLSTAKVPKIEFDAIEGNPVRALDDLSDELNMWVIEPKFETIILDFSRTTLEAAGRYPTNPTQGNVCRGMWHQYGDLPVDHNGLTLQIKDSRGSIDGADQGVGTLNNFDRITSGSLADLVGFAKESKTLGTPPMEKVIREAIVAVPFVMRGREKQFIRIPKVQLRDAQGLERRRKDPSVEEVVLAGESVRNMVEAMDKYVIPPRMNFLKYDQISPFVMYFMEFEHRLTQQDLVDIWQNLPPNIALNFKQESATISHDLVPGEFFNIGAKDNLGSLELPKDIRWMVFKVKQKAKWNYYEKTSDVADDERFKFNFRGRGKGKLTAPDYSWNWPYDYFSLVELVKIDAEVEFSEIIEVPEGGVPAPIPPPQI